MTPGQCDPICFPVLGHIKLSKDQPQLTQDGRSVWLIPTSPTPAKQAQPSLSWGSLETVSVLIIDSDSRASGLRKLQNWLAPGLWHLAERLLQSFLASLGCVIQTGMFLMLALQQCCRDSRTPARQPAQGYTVVVHCSCLPPSGGRECIGCHGAFGTSPC